MNVYEKLNEARVRFQSGNPKMSGENTFAKYQYFELADILPIINRLGVELKFACVVSFKADLATLSFIDTEKPEDVISFTSPMSTAALKGCHEVQNLGAVETYVKRYLYQNAFEIVENDALNGTQGSGDRNTPGEKTPNAEKPSSEFAKLKGELIDWLNVTPPILNREWTEYANGVISDGDIEGIQKSIAEAKRVSALKRK